MLVLGLVGTGVPFAYPQTQSKFGVVFHSYKPCISKDWILLDANRVLLSGSVMSWTGVRWVGH
jgi:hypothetical protein